MTSLAELAVRLGVEGTVIIALVWVVVKLSLNTVHIEVWQAECDRNKSLSEAVAANTDSLAKLAEYVRGQRDAT
jgi:hypothetical protein